MIDQFEQTIRSHPGVIRVQQALALAGHLEPIIIMREATHTAQAAADALGCTVGEIAKSIIFHSASERAVLVITSGKNRVDEKRVVALVGEKIGKADADFVRAQTGFVIGGVSPLAHATAPIVLLDEDLLAYAHVYPAAGHPNTMFKIAPTLLVQLACARVANIRSEK